MYKLPLVAGVCLIAASLLLASGVLDVLPYKSIIAGVVAFAAILMVTTLVLSWLRWLKALASDRASFVYQLSATIERLAKLEQGQMKEYTRDAMEMKKDIQALEKRRVIILNAVGERDVSRTEQVLTRRSPGPPIDKFPVILHTDRKNVSFQDLGYKILTSDIAQFYDHEREVIGDLTIFTIHNRLKKLIRYGERVPFAHQTECNLDNPEGDWVGIETSGGPSFISIEVWFPPDYEVTLCHAYSGTPPNPDRDQPVAPDPQITKGTLPDETTTRARIVWESSQPAPDTTYYVAWQARRTT